MFVSVKRVFLSAITAGCAATGVTAATAPSVLAKDMLVPLQKCASPAGSIAVNTSTLGIWRTVGINDPAQFLEAIATESNCFTAAPPGTTATYRMTATPIAENEFRAGAARFSGRTGLMPSELRRPKNMVWAHVAILDSSGRAVASGVGRNNTSRLDYSQWESANRGVLSFNSDKSSRKYGGAMLNAFGDARPTIENGLKGSTSLSSVSSNSSTGKTRPLVSSSAPSGPILNMEEALDGMKGNSPAFAQRFQTPRRLKFNTYFGHYLPRQGGPDAVFFKKTPNGIGLNNDVQCFVKPSGSLVSQVKNMKPGTPITVEGTFMPANAQSREKQGEMFGFSYTYFQESDVVLAIGSEDCRITGTWDPFARELKGGPTRSTKSLADILDERKANEFAFFRNYKDSRVAISGAVSNISETEAGEIRVTLNDPRTDGFGGQLSCALPSSQANRAAALAVGQRATIVGTVQKNDSYLPIPFDLKNCELP